MPARRRARRCAPPPACTTNGRGRAHLGRRGASRRAGADVAGRAARRRRVARLRALRRAARRRPRPFVAQAGGGAQRRARRRAGMAVAYALRTWSARPARRRSSSAAATASGSTTYPDAGGAALALGIAGHGAGRTVRTPAPKRLTRSPGVAGGRALHSEGRIAVIMGKGSARAGPPSMGSRPESGVRPWRRARSTRTTARRRRSAAPPSRAGGTP